jgi:hypothetical protein
MIASLGRLRGVTVALPDPQSTGSTLSDPGDMGSALPDPGGAGSASPDLGGTGYASLENTGPIGARTAFNC